jgi:hypothetical protein
MKHKLHILTLFFLIALAGCATGRHTDGVPHPSEAQVRQRLAQVSVLQDAGARVRDVRFANEGRSILVLLDLPAGSKAVPEFILRDDGFNRYKSEFFTENLQGARKSVIIDFGKR